MEPVLAATEVEADAPDAETPAAQPSVEPAPAPEPAAPAFAGQRRKRYRVSTQLWARIEQPTTMETQLLDLSLDGARLNRRVFFPRGTELQLVIELPGLVEFALTAEIVWLQDAATGIRFTNVSEHQAETLRKTLMREELRNTLKTTS